MYPSSVTPTLGVTRLRPVSSSVVKARRRCVMKVFIAGATGVIGSRMVPALVRRGHEVVGTTRTPWKTERLAQLGATPVVVDALDEIAVKEAVAEAAPDVVVHELTSIPDSVDPRKLDQQFAETNRLRTEGMDHLLEAARAAGARRFIAQSFAAWAYARTGGPVKTEEDPIETDPPSSVRETLAAILHVERSLAEATDLEGIALRYGGFYGPGTSLGECGSVIEMVRKRRFPLVGRSSAVWSFIHIDDAAARRSPRSSTAAAASTTSPTTTGAGVGLAARAGRRARCAAAAPRAVVARAYAHRDRPAWR